MYIVKEKEFLFYRNVYSACWDCARTLSRFASWYFINQIHMFLGNVLVSHNPSVYVPVATNLPRFDLSLTHSI